MKFTPPHYRSRILRNSKYKTADSDVKTHQENLKKLYLLRIFCVTIAISFIGLFTYKINEYLNNRDVVFPRFEAFAWCPNNSGYLNLKEAYHNLPVTDATDFLYDELIGNGPGLVQSGSRLNKRFYSAVQAHGVIRPLVFSWTPTQHNMIVLNFHEVQQQLKGCKSVFLRGKGLHFIALEQAEHADIAVGVQPIEGKKYSGNGNDLRISKIANGLFKDDAAVLIPEMVTLEEIEWYKLQRTEANVVYNSNSGQDVLFDARKDDLDITSVFNVDISRELFFGDYLIGYKKGKVDIALKGGKERFELCQVERDVYILRDGTQIDTKKECHKVGPENWEIEISSATGLQFPSSLLLQIATDDTSHVQKTVVMDFQQLVAGKDTILKNPLNSSDSIELRLNDYIPLSNFVPKHKQFDFKYGKVLSSSSIARPTRFEIENLYNLVSTESNIEHYPGYYMTAREDNLAEEEKIENFPAYDGFYEKITLEDPDGRYMEEFSLLIYAALLGIAITMFVEILFISFEITRIKKHIGNQKLHTAR